MKFTLILAILLLLSFYSNGQARRLFSLKKNEVLSSFEEKGVFQNSEFKIIQEECLDVASDHRKSVENRKACIERNVQLPKCNEVVKSYFLDFDYFSIWDTKNVDPYSVTRDALKDSLIVDLRIGDGWSFPLKRGKEINSKYGARRYRFHHGIDIDVSIGEPVFSVFDGIVRIAKYNHRGFGYYVLVRHNNGLETIYAHLKKFHVEPGQVVKAGQMIGVSGNSGRSTGPHLHFETRFQGYAFDPNYLFDFEKEKVKSDILFIAPLIYQKLLEEYKAVYHKIRSGDSLWLLASKYRTTISNICSLNNISRKSVLKIGSRVRVR